MEDLPLKTALGIGCFQVLSLIPGTSRSGSTIIGGLLLGCTRSVASKFTFFLAIPRHVWRQRAQAGEVRGARRRHVWHQRARHHGVGCLVAFVVSLLTIKWLMNFVRKHTFIAFGVYRIVLGVVVLAYFLLLA